MSLIGGLVRSFEADVHRPNHTGGQVRPYEVDVAFPRTGTMLRYPCEDDAALPPYGNDVASSRSCGRINSPLRWWCTIIPLVGADLSARKRRIM